MPSTEAIRDEILRVAERGLDRHESARASVRVLRRAVAFDAVAAVWFDPVAALPVDMWIDDAGLSRAGIERDACDIERFKQLAASGRPAARGGALPTGVGNELRAVYVGDSGMWNGIVLYRRAGAPAFAVRDVDLLASLTGGCPEAQRVTLERDLSTDAGDGDRGLLLLDDEDGIEMADVAATGWLDELRGRRPRLPLVVTSVAQRAREIALGNASGDAVATARARTASGRWVLVRGSVIRNGTRTRTAVTLEPARSPELAELIADAHGLTARERCVTELVAQGLPNAVIAAQLYLSVYTVQDHLKAIFEKLGVSSRSQLVARLFLDTARVGGRLSASAGD